MEPASSSSSSSERPPQSSGAPRRQNPVLSEQQIHVLKQDPWLNKDTVIETKSVHPDDMVLCHLFCACFERPKQLQN